jgi:hypothetical protein
VSRLVVNDAEINKRWQDISIVYTIEKCRKITEKSIRIFDELIEIIEVFHQWMEN